MKAKPKPEPKDHAISNARAWMESIREQVKALEAADNGDDQRAREDARRTIEEGPLSVEVREDWHTPGDTEPTVGEYMILLSTGGPALRIVGELDRWAQPENARLEHQDWFKPWTEYPLEDEDDRAALLTYARQFYFGE